MAARPDHRVRTNDAVACQRDPVWAFAFDASEESRSSSAPWCRRRPALLEDDEGSLSRGQEEKLYDYYGISYDATKRGAA